MSLKRILISMLAGVGLGAGHAASATAQQSEVRQVAVVGDQKSAKLIEADGRFGGSLDAILRRPSHTPYEWGISRACQQMRRKNHMRSIGIAGSKI